MYTIYIDSSRPQRGQGATGIVDGTVVNLEGEDYLTAAEACALMGVKAATLYAYVSRGLIPSYRQGIRRRRLYKRRDVEALLQLRPSAGTLLGEETAAHPLSRDVPRAEDWIPYIN